MSQRISDEQVKQAEGVLWRYYRQWINDEVDNIVDEVFRNEITDAESLMEAVDRNTDDGLIYTHDQRTVLFVSESVSEGQDELNDMGGGGEDPTAALAVTTYRIDVRDALDRIGLGGDFNRDEWIRETAMREPELAVKWDEHLRRGGQDLED